MFAISKRSAQALAEGGRMEARQGRDEAVTRRLGSREPSATAAHQSVDGSARLPPSI
jgi:hypothetical protein